MNSTPLVFDRALYLSRQGSASGEALRLLDQRVADDLGDRLGVINRQFENALLIAPRPYAFETVLNASGKIGKLDQLIPTADDDLHLAASSYNAVFHLLDLHGVNDVPGQLAQVANALQPDGLALFAFFAGETLHELREAWLDAETTITGGASPRVAPMIDLRESGGLLQRAGLALPVADMDRATLRYANPLALMNEVKSMGLSNCLAGRTRNVTSQRLLFAAAAAYPVDRDGRITATLDIAWAMAWKPHPSQQQPLKPGSAKARLADALKVEETKLTRD